MSVRSWLVIIGLLCSVTAPAAAQELVIYSGRSKSLVDPLVERFEEETGMDVRVKYGRGAQLLATLREEGQFSPADVFWANTAGTLGAANNAGLLDELPPEILETPGAFTPSSGRWAPITTRFRVLAYNPENIDPADLPASVLDLPELEQFEGRVGWTPTYSSFQDFITALRVTKGREVAGDWLQRMKQLAPKSYTSNTPMIEALDAGEIDIALTNHYYVHRLKHGGAEGEYEGHQEEEHEEEEHEEHGHAAEPDAGVGIYHFAPGDPGNLALVTGAARLKSSSESEAAHNFLQFLLSASAQQFAAEQVNEYPVIRDVPLPDHLLPMERVLELSPQLDFERLRELEETTRLLREQGLF